MSAPNRSVDHKAMAAHPDALCVVAECKTAPTKSGACSRHSYALRYIPFDEQPWMGPAKDRPKKCSVAACVFPRYGRNKHCYRHYNRVRAHGTAADPKPRHYAPTCAIAYCGAKSQTYSVCSAHAQTLLADRWAMVRDESPRYCLEGCDEPTWSNGLCRLHYSRLRNATPNNAPRRACVEVDCDEESVDRRRCATHLREFIAADPGRVMCTSSGCEKNVIARGLCSAHYYAARRAGTLDQHTTRGQGVPRLAVTCRATGCESGSKAHGLCQPHYDKARRLSKRDEVPLQVAIDELATTPSTPSTTAAADSEAAAA